MCMLISQMENLLTTRGIQFVDVTLNSAYISSISVTFQITLPFNINQNLALLNFVTYFSRPFTMFGNFTVRKGDRSLTQVTAVGKLSWAKQLSFLKSTAYKFIMSLSQLDSCPCRPLTGSSMEPGLEFSTDSNYATFELCSGVSISPCNCTLDTCQVCTLNIDVCILLLIEVQKYSFFGVSFCLYTSSAYLTPTCFTQCMDVHTFHILCAIVSLH